MNEALFNDNGQCGYILKPSILRDVSLGFNPNDTTTMKNKCLLKLKIISGQNLAAGQDDKKLFKDIIDPYVQINIFGVPADRLEERTKTVDDNGYNPLWNEDFEFRVNCPELAFVKFTVKDDDVSKDDMVGEYTVRFENLRSGKYNKFTLFKPLGNLDFFGGKNLKVNILCERRRFLVKKLHIFFIYILGYRHFKLKNRAHKGTLFVGVTIDIV